MRKTRSPVQVSSEGYASVANVVAVIILRRPGGSMLSPLLDLAYAKLPVKSDSAALERSDAIDEKRLYIFAGFDDYRIATRERQAESMRISAPTPDWRRRASPCLWAVANRVSWQKSRPSAPEFAAFF